MTTKQTPLLLVVLMLTGGSCAIACSSKDGTANNPTSKSSTGGFSQQPEAGAAGLGGERAAPGDGENGGSKDGGGESSGGANAGSGSNVSAAGAPPGNANGGAAVGAYSPHGFRPATLANDDADKAYAAWKASFLEDCQDGSFRVKWSDATVTVSESIGYGMLLTVSHDEQPIFDGLWQYYKNNRDNFGLMHWKRSGCPGATSGDNAASDSDLDVAMALVMASRRWSSVPYLEDARSLIRLIKKYETVSGDDNLDIMKPGDHFGGITCLNFSYFAPGYYRAFAEIVPEQAAFWNKLADDTYTIIDPVSNAMTGLVPNWCTQAGVTSETGPSGCSNYKRADQYGSDAARTPWRIATDYAWYGTPQAKAWLTRVTTWVKTVGIANVVDWYQLDGTPTGTVHSVVVVGAFANAAIAVDQATTDEFFQEVVTMAPQNGYFSSSLRALYTLLPLGRFTPSGGQ